MRRVARSAVVVVFAGSAASAADLPRPSSYAAPAPLSSYGWVGPYLGGNLGYAWGAASNNPTRPAGFVGGIDAGYNWQAGEFVFGAEADFQLSGANDTFAPWKFSNPWFGTLRARAGYAMSNVLIYGTGGLALGELTSEPAGLASESHTSIGWTAGAGIEAGFASHWSGRLEYLFVDLASSNFAATGVSNGYSASVFRAGVNYHF